MEGKRFALIVLMLVVGRKCLNQSVAVNDQYVFFSHYPIEVAEHIKNAKSFNSFKFQQELCTPHISCNESVINLSQSYTSTCCTCDCTSDCTAIGNCCYDMKPASPPQQHAAGKSKTRDGEKCIKPSITGGNPRLWSRSYLLVKSCSVAYIGDAAHKCLDNQTFSQDYLTPVYSEFTNVHYANIYCAQCNFQNLTEPWEPYLECETLQNVKDALTATADNSSLLQSVKYSDRCALTWKSSRENRKRCFLEVDIVSECDQKANYYEFNLSQLCKYEPFWAFESELYMYKNVYCFLCHEQDSFAGFQACKISGGFAIMLIPFTALINVRSLQPGIKTTSTGEKQPLCKHGLTYNEILAKCLNETCAPSRIKKDAECIVVMETINNVVLDYRLQLTYANFQEHPKTEADILSDALAIVFSNNKIHLVCDWSITYSTQADTSWFIAHVTIKRTISQAVNLFSEYQDLKSALRSKQNSYFRADFDETLLKPLPVDTINFVSFPNGNEPCDDSIAMQNVQFCDTISLTADEFDIENGTLVVGSLSFSPLQFVLRPLSNGQNGFAQICKDVYISMAMDMIVDRTDFDNRDSAGVSTSFETKQGQQNPAYLQFNESVTPGIILTTVCILCSMLSLVILICVYIFLQQTRSVPSLNTISLAGNLLFSQCLFLFGIGQTDVEWLCISIGIMIHYSWLAYMFWTCASCFHLFHTFVVSSWSTEDCNRSRFVKYSLCCYTCPSIFIGVNILFSFFKYNHIGYGGSLCYISTPLMIGVTFALPLGLVTVSNSIFFIIVIFKFKITGVQLASAKQKCSDLNIYLRMSTLTGVTWLSGFVFVFTEMEWLEYVFILLNASHGVFLMMSFLFNRRIYVKMKEKVRASFQKRNRARRTI